jgi:PAS domain S-box-containing protein
MAVGAFLRFPLATWLLGNRTFKSEEEKTRGLLLTGVLATCLPMPVVTFLLIESLMGQTALSLFAAELILIALIVGLRLGLRVQVAAVAFGLCMEAVFMEGALRLESPSMVIGIVFIPFLSVFAAGRGLATILLVPPVIFVLRGVFAVFNETGSRQDRTFKLDVPSEAVNFVVLLGLIFAAACVVERIIHNLFAAHATAHEAAMGEIVARKEKERLLETILKAVPIPLFVRDADFRYSVCSDSFFEYVRKSRAEVIGKRFEEIFSFSMMGTSKDTDLHLKETGLAERYSTTVERRDGSTQSFTVFKVPLQNDEGDFVGTVGALMDESERYEKERKLEALLDSNRSALALLGHDLKTPIGSFRDLVRSMERDECVEPAEFHEVLIEMGKSLDSLYRLLEELLDWSKADSSIAEFTPRPLLLAPRVQNTFSLCRLQAEAKELALTSKIPEDLVIHADERMVETILRNLVGNAIKFTPRGGSIQVAGVRDEAGRKTFVSVSDTGIGMPAAMLATLFTEGGIRHRRGTDGEVGTGLGLGLCRRLIERHGGNLSIDSVVEKGSSFTLAFSDRIDLMGMPCS